MCRIVDGSKTSSQSVVSPSSSSSEKEEVEDEERDDGLRERVFRFCREERSPSRLLKGRDQSIFLV
jgi:hypothetical protein